MKFTSKMIKTAWKLRRESAKSWNCGIMEISWKECFRMAKEKIEMTGTEKQVVWARDIVTKSIAHLTEQLDITKKSIETSERKDTSKFSAERMTRRNEMLTRKRNRVDTVEAAISKVSKIIDASWVIKNEENLTRDNCFGYSVDEFLETVSV